MMEDSTREDPDHGRPVVPDVGGKMGESKGVWRILLTSLGMAVAAMVVIGVGYATFF